MAEEKAPAKKAEKDGKKTKRPSALKRDIQGEKKRLRNRSFRSSVQTAIRGLTTSIDKKESVDSIKTKLSGLYGMMDKGVKKGIYKAPKAARTKSRLAARVSKG